MSARQVLMAVGIAGVILSLGWGAWNHIVELNKMVERLEVRNAQLERERTRLDQTLSEREIAKEEIKNAHNQDIAAVTEIIRTDEIARDWSGDALPDDFKRLLKRDSGNQPSAGLFDGTNSHTCIYRGNQFGLAALGTGNAGAA